MAEPEASKTADAATAGATQKPAQEQDAGGQKTDQGDELTLEPSTRLAAAIAAATESSSDEKGAAEQKTDEQKAAAAKAGEQQSDEQKTDEQKAAEQKAADAKAAEEKTDAEKAAEAKAAEEKKKAEEGGDKDLDPALTKSWENVIKIEKESREIKQQLKTRDDEISRLQEQVQQFGGLQKTQQWIEQFKSNPYAALESLGVSYEAWTEFRANGGQSGATQRMDALERRFDAKEEASQEADKQAAEASQAKVQASVAEYAKSVRELMGQEGLEHLDRFGTVQEVMDYVGTHWNETKQVLAPDVAARAYNEFLKGQNPGWTPGQKTEEGDKKAAEVKAAAEAKAADEAKTAEEAKARKAEEEKKGKMTTLTNDTASVADSGEDEDTLDPQKRIQRATRAALAGN